jgi:hypothetical protein
LILILMSVVGAVAYEIARRRAERRVRALAASAAEAEDEEMAAATVGGAIGQTVGSTA